MIISRHVGDFCNSNKRILLRSKSCQKKNFVKTISALKEGISVRASQRICPSTATDFEYSQLDENHTHIAVTDFALLYIVQRVIMFFNKWREIYRSYGINQSVHSQRANIVTVATAAAAYREEA